MATRTKAQTQKARQKKKPVKKVAESESVNVEDDIKPFSKSAGFKFPKGNKFWQCRAKHGRDGIWSDPAKLLDDCFGYFEWLNDNPLIEVKGFAYKGDVTKAELPKMRAATMCGLCAHLGITPETWNQYSKKPGFSDVCAYVNRMIRDQKFSGAAADLLNPAIIARDLGLKDVTVNEQTSPDGSMSPKRELTTDELKEELKKRGLPTEIFNQ